MQMPHHARIKSLTFNFRNRSPSVRQDKRQFDAAAHTAVAWCFVSVYVRVRWGRRLRMLMMPCRIVRLQPIAERPPTKPAGAGDDLGGNLHNTRGEENADASHLLSERESVGTHTHIPANVLTINTRARARAFPFPWNQHIKRGTAPKEFSATHCWRRARVAHRAS